MAEDKEKDKEKERQGLKKVAPPFEKAMCLRAGCGHPPPFHTEVGCVGHNPVLDFESTATCQGACSSFLATIPVVPPSTEMLKDKGVKK